MQQNRPLHFYVANLGSEVQRVLGWKEKGDVVAMNNAYERAIAIIETIKNFSNSNASAEMDILQTSLFGLMNKNENLGFGKKELSAYFYPFVMRLTNLSK